MLTRLQVSGFKNLFDVDLRFGPLTCMVGPNGVGKSNVFDAIRFLNLLSRVTIPEAVQQLRETRGRSQDPNSLFTSFQNFIAPGFELTAEMLLEREVEDDFGVRARAATTAVRYSVAFRLHREVAGERLELAREELVPLTRREARASIAFPSKKKFRDSCLAGRRSVPFVTTEGTGEAAQIRLHQEGHGGRKVPAPKSSRTVLGGTISADFPTVLAVHREVESWQTLLLEPSAMRAPSFYTDPKRIDARGGNIPAALARLSRQDKGGVYAAVANRLGEFIDDVLSVDVRDDQKTEALTLVARGKDGVERPARSLSDGTLRFLALTVLSLDPSARGVICLEEPENGIHPERISSMVRLLGDIAVDAKLAVGSDNPLRQVIINTHSPVVVRNVAPDDVMYVETAFVERDGSRGSVATVAAPKATWRAGKPVGARTLARGQIRPYLEGSKSITSHQMRLWEESSALQSR
ncbi:MAG: AAA family ATPase [Planctomycetales bacterium]|nr:AAA family ATPase [Planctomycetales bacterium]